MHIVCGKYDKGIDLSQCRKLDPHTRVRIGSKNPNLLTHPDYIPIATDGKIIVYNNEIFQVNDFLAGYKKIKTRTLIVLTQKERQLILKLLIDFDLEVSVFELKYPIFTHIKYLPEAEKNYLELKRLIHKIKQLGISGKNLANYFSTKNQFKVERTIRQKNSFDQYFALGYQGGYQEVFKLREERKDRIVIALDFNSMFPSCMDGYFVEPKYIHYKYIGICYSNKVRLENGLYRVVLKGVKDPFYMDFHPFKYTILNRKQYFSIRPEHQIELLLFKNEIEEYSQYFSETEIVEGLISTNRIKHPLYRDAVKLYKFRQKAKLTSNTLMHDYYKFWLVTLHSASNPKRSETLHFNCARSLKKHLSKTFMFQFSDELEDDQIFNLIHDGKNFDIQKRRYGYKIRQPRHNHSDAVFSLSSQVIANSRVKMMKIMKKFLNHPTVELCYANIDSIHISIARDELDSFLCTHENLISDQLGDLRIQCIADTGYWFDIGRYWLFKQGKVIQFKNRVFNHPANETPFARHRKLTYICRGDLFTYAKSVYVSIENSFSHSKRLQHVDRSVDYTNFARYSIDEVESLNVAGDTYEKEVLRSKAFKVDLFSRVATA